MKENIVRVKYSVGFKIQTDRHCIFLPKELFCEWNGIVTIFYTILIIHLLYKFEPGGYDTFE